MGLEDVFQCTLCGICCKGQGGIIVTKKEIDRIAKFLGLDNKEFEEKFLEKEDSNKYSIKIKEDGYCIFFDKDRRCTIHPVKPNICIAWPFFKGNLEDENSFEMAKEYCPGIKKEIDFEQFKREGIKYLKEKQLISQQEDGPNALKVKF